MFAVISGDVKSKMKAKFVSNSRSALRSICSIPAASSVIEAARKLSTLTLKKTNLQQQLDFLKTCRKEKVFPKNILTLKLPTLHQAFKAKFDIDGQLRSLPPSIVPKYLKLQSKIERMTNTIHCFFLKAEIDEKYLEVKRCTLEINHTLKTLHSVASPRETRYINRVIEQHTQIERCESQQKLEKKLKIIKTACQKPENSNVSTTPNLHEDQGVSKANNPEESTNTSNEEATLSSGVIVTVPSTYSNAATNILEKGRNFKISPDNGRKLETDFQTGVWRMIAAMRYSNPAYEFGIPNPARNPDLNTILSLKQVVSRFDKDLAHPPKAIPPVEETIKQLKCSMEGLKHDLRKIHIPRNYLKEDLESLTEAKTRENVGIILTDKTNNIAIMERELVEQKLADHLREPAYQLLEEDPTNKYETAANNLFTDICIDLGIDVTKPPPNTF